MNSTSITTTTPFISVIPDQLTFQVEREKQSYCDLKVVNKTEHYVAFKVKTTSPKKYFVRPNSSVVQPWDACIIRVTLQALQDYTPDMQCKDKFLLQSTIVAPCSDFDEIPQDTFNKDTGNVIDECKLRVVYTSPSSHTSVEDDGITRSNVSTALQQLKEERDSALRITEKLQQELDTVKMANRQRKAGGRLGFSFRFAVFACIIGILVGVFFNMSFSSPSSVSDNLNNP